MAHSSLISRLQSVSRCLTSRYTAPLGTAFTTTFNYSGSAQGEIIDKPEPDKPNENVKQNMIKSKMKINVQHLMSESEISYDNLVKKTQNNDVGEGTSRQENATKGRQLNEEERKLLKEEIDSIMATSEFSTSVRTASDSIQKCKKVRFRNEIITKFLFKARQSEGDISDLIQTQECKSLLKYLQMNVGSLETGKLISCLRSLVLSFPSEGNINKLVFSLQKEMSVRVRYTNVDVLIQFYQILQSQNTKQGKRLLNQCEEKLKRCVPRKPQELMLLMNHFANKKDGKVFLQLEDYVFDMISKLSVDNYCDTINCLAVYGSRNTSLIHLVLFYLNKTYEQRNLAQISALLFSCGKLAIYDSELFKKLSENLLAIKPTSTKKICTILKSMSILGWRSDETITHLLDTLVDENIELDPANLESTLHALATLNYCPRHILEILMSKCTQVDVNGVSELQWLNIVWSLAVLQGSSPQLVSSVLEPGFIDKLKEKGYKKWQYQSRLVAVHNTAMFDLRDYNGPTLFEDMLSYRPQDQAVKSALVEDVLTTLATFTGDENLCKTHVMTQYGYKIDAELLVDQTGSVVEFSDTQESGNTCRVAIKVQGFHDLTIPGNLPKGPEALMIRHLGCQGYKVLIIPFYEWSGLNTDEKKHNYLKNKIRNIVL